MNRELTREQIEHVRDLLAKATPRPWLKKHAGSQDEIWSNRGLVAEMSLYPHGSVLVDANASLIEELINNADALLAAAEEALELREALEYAADKQADLYSLQRETKRYVCIISESIDGEESRGEGSTPLKAIHNARRGA